MKANQPPPTPIPNNVQIHVLERVNIAECENSMCPQKHRSSSCSVHWVEAWLKKTRFVVPKHFSNCHPMLLQQKDICTWSRIAFLTQTCHLHPRWSVTINIPNWFNEIISLRVYKRKKVLKKIELPDKIYLNSTGILYEQFNSIILNYMVYFSHPM